MVAGHTSLPLPSETCVCGVIISSRHLDQGTWGVTQMGAAGVSKAPPPEQAPLSPMRVPPYQKESTVQEDKAPSGKSPHTVTWTGTQSPSQKLEQIPEKAPRHRASLRPS